MARDIGQTLLKDTKQGGRNVGGKRFTGEQPGGCTGCRFEPEIPGPAIPRRPPKPISKIPGLSSSRFCEQLGSSSRLTAALERILSSIWPFLRAAARQPGEVHIHRGQQLAQLIVDFAGDPGPLLLRTVIRCAARLRNCSLEARSSRSARFVWDRSEAIQADSRVPSRRRGFKERRTGKGGPFC